MYTPVKNSSGNNIFKTKYFKILIGLRVKCAPETACFQTQATLKKTTKKNTIHDNISIHYMVNTSLKLFSKAVFL